MQESNNSSHEIFLQEILQDREAAVLNKINLITKSYLAAQLFKNRSEGPEGTKRGSISDVQKILSLILMMLMDVATPPLATNKARSRCFHWQRIHEAERRFLFNSSIFSPLLFSILPRPAPSVSQP